MYGWIRCAAMSDHPIETITPDPSVSAYIETLQRMTTDELIEDILRHEKEVRGVDWRALAAEGPEGLGRGRRETLDAAREKFRSAGLAEADMPGLGRLLSGDDDIRLVPTWGIDEKTAQEWERADGPKLKDMVLLRLH